jgi:hypothetical protein
MNMVVSKVQYKFAFSRSKRDTVRPIPLALTPGGQFHNSDMFLHEHVTVHSLTFHGIARISFSNNVKLFIRQTNFLDVYAAFSKSTFYAREQNCNGLYKQRE